MLGDPTNQVSDAMHFFVSMCYLVFQKTLSID